MKALPKRNIEWVSDKISLEENRNQLYIHLNDTIITDELFNILSNKRGYSIKMFINSSITTFNDVLVQLSTQKINGNVELIFGEKVKVNNDSMIRLNDLPENVKISFFSHCISDNAELSTWCLNLSDYDFQKVFRVVSNKTMAYNLLEERQIAKRVYESLSRSVNFESMSDTEKMNYMFDYVRRHFPYDKNHELIGPDGNYRDDADRSLGADPVKVFKNGTGVCSGRSRLLKILLNNPYMRVKCYDVEGYCGNLAHEWNEFIDEYGNVYAYDLSFNIKHVNDITSDNAHSINSRSHLVEEQLNKRAHESTVNLPPRRTNQVPQLPKRRVLKPLPSRNKSY